MQRQMAVKPLSIYQAAIHCIFCIAGGPEGVVRMTRTTGLERLPEVKRMMTRLPT